jgi:glycosyltransferase involved in cell wall biosynthesis
LEGFSNTFLEAWAVGVPVVSTKNVNPDYIITTYKLGIITDNYEEIPKKIDQLISDQQYKNFSQRCIDYVKEKHDPVKLAQKFLNEMINSTSTK